MCKMVLDHHNAIQEAFNMLDNSDKKALIHHFNGVSAQFGDYMFGIDGAKKSEFQMYMTEFNEPELKILLVAVAEAQLLEIRGEYSSLKASKSLPMGGNHGASSYSDLDRHFKHLRVQEKE